MNNSAIAIDKTQYGAFELKRLYQKYYSIGFAISVLILGLLIGAYIFIQSISKDDENNISTVRILKYTDLGPPPSLNDQTQQQLAVTAPTIAPNVGVPVPVPDAEAPKEQTIATQQQMSQVSSPVGEGTGGNVQITKDLKVEQPTDQAPDINSFVAVEKEPVPVVTARPEYPDLAKRAGIEGTVYVKILVSKEGKPIKAVVIKSDSEVFNQPAVNAAMKFVFTPAIQHKSPVMVWVVVPFRFKLNQ